MVWGRRVLHYDAGVQIPGVVDKNGAQAVVVDKTPEPNEDEQLVELRAVVARLRARLGWLAQGGAKELLARRGPKPVPTVASVAGSKVPKGKTPSGPTPVARPVDTRPDSTVAEGEEASVAAQAALEHVHRLALQNPAPRKDPVLQAVLSTSLHGGTEYPELTDLPTGAEGLRAIREVIGDCRRCKLCHGRNQLVFGEGRSNPWIAFVGEGPGADEDRTGRPFVGAAGELLSKMIKAMGDHALKLGQPELASRLRREEVYIGNIVKCRPPGNRTPEPDEIAACGGFITAQLACLSPRVIVALGRTPTQFLLHNNAPLGRLRGQFGVFRGVPVLPTYHPAYLLRTPSAKTQVWEDLKLVIARLSDQPTISASPP